MIHCQERSSPETDSVYPVDRPESSILAGLIRQQAKITPMDTSTLVYHFA